VLLIGPNDLSISLGMPGKIFDPLVQEAIGKVADSADRHNKIFSIHGSDALLELWEDRMQMVMTSIDMNVLTQGFAALAKKYK
jgi:2-keto-3-deoxy-L-rhamnonate aldolase RhmA